VRPLAILAPALLVAPLALPPAQALLPPVVLAADSLPGNAFFAGRVNLSAGGTLSLSIRVETAQWPVHDGFGFWLLTASGVRVLHGGIFVLETEHKAYAQTEVAGIPFGHTLVQQRFGGTTIVTVTLLVDGLWPGPWVFAGAGASPDATRRVSFELRGPVGAILAASNNSTSALFAYDEAFRGAAHAQFAYAPTMTRAEAGVGLSVPFQASQRTFAAFVANGQVAQTRVTGPQVPFSSGPCHFLSNAPAGSWQFHASTFVGATPVLLAPIGFPCSSSAAVNAVTATTSPEGLFLVAADGPFP